MGYGMMRWGDGASYGEILGNSIFWVPFRSLVGERVFPLSAFSWSLDLLFTGSGF